MTQNKIVEIGANVVNSKKNEGGGGSRLKNMEQGKEWSTDTQNKLRDDLAEDIKNEVQKKTLNLKNKIPFREVKRGDTLLAVIAGMKRGGALENVKNINNLKVKIGEKEFANMFVDDLPNLQIGQKIWVEGDRIIVADEMQGEVEEVKFVAPEKKEKEKTQLGTTVKKEKKVPVKTELEKKETPPQSDLEKAIINLKIELLKSNPDLQELIDLKIAVEQAKAREKRKTEIKKNPLAAVDKMIAELQKAEQLEKAEDQEKKAEAEKLKKEAEQKEKIEVAKNAVKNLGEFLDKNLSAENTSAEIQKLIDDLNNQNKLAGEKVGELGDAAPKLKTKFDGLQNRIQPKLEELRSFLTTAKAREEVLRIEKEKAEKLKNKIEANRKKLEVLEKTKVPGSNWLDLMKAALIQIGIRGRDFLEKSTQGDITIARNSFGFYPGFSVEDGVFEGSTINSVLGRLGKPGVAAVELDKKRSPVDTARHFELSPNYLNTLGVAKKVVVRFWKGSERSTFWHLSDAIKNSSDVAMVARVKFRKQNVDNFIQILEDGQVKDANGKIIENKELKKILRLEDKAEIKRHLPDFLSK